MHLKITVHAYSGIKLLLNFQRWLYNFLLCFTSKINEFSIALYSYKTVSYVIWNFQLQIFYSVSTHMVLFWTCWAAHSWPLTHIFPEAASHLFSIRHTFSKIEADSAPKYQSIVEKKNKSLPLQYCSNGRLKREAAYKSFRCRLLYTRLMGWVLPDTSPRGFFFHENGTPTSPGDDYTCLRAEIYRPNIWGGDAFSLSLSLSNSRSLLYRYT